MIAAVALLSKLEFESSIVEQIRAQTEPHLEIFVRNVEGVSRARNQGLAMARSVGVEMVSFFDDDDRYAPGYLYEARAGLERAHLTGKPEHYVEDVVRGEFYLFEAFDSDVMTAGGGTLSFRLDDEVPEFDENREFLEDFDWVLRMKELGRPMFSLSRNLYMKRQFGRGHTYPQSTSELVRGRQKLSCEPDWMRAQ